VKFKELNLKQQHLKNNKLQKLKERKNLRKNKRKKKLEERLKLKKLKLKFENKVYHLLDFSFSFF